MRRKRIKLKPRKMPRNSRRELSLRETKKLSKEERMLLPRSMLKRSN
jgi:hypothetical protein